VLQLTSMLSAQPIVFREHLMGLAFESSV
jgi:hypothetical protein